MSSTQAVTADCKEYTERGVRFSVSQIEELSFSHLYEKQAQLVGELETYRASHSYFFSTLPVTDVSTQN